MIRSLNHQIPQTPEKNPVAPKIGNCKTATALRQWGASMPLHDSDISWQVLRQIIKDWAGDTAQIAEVRPLDGGCINTTLCITTDTNDRAVLKIAPHRVNREF